MDEQGKPGRDELLIRFIRQLNLRLASNLEPDVILGGLVGDAAALLAADEGCLRLFGPDDPVGHTAVRKAASSGSWPLQVAKDVSGFVSLRSQHLASPDLVNDPRFPNLRGLDTRVRAVLAVPLLFDGRVAGLLAVSCATPGREWPDDEVQLLSMAANYTSEPLIRAQRRYEQHRAEEIEREMKDLKRAREVQMGLVPARPLVLAGWQVCGQVVPAQRVGGDLFHYSQIGSNSLGMVVADVEGKGLPAALTMAMVRGSLGEIGRSRLSVPEALSHVGRQLADVDDPTRMTMFYGEFDVERRLLRYSSAGHPPPLLRRRNGEIETLEAGGPLFGLFDVYEYPVGEIRLEAGDALLAYSDGVTEAEGPSREFFGVERLVTEWSGCRGRASRDSLDLIRRALDDFRGHIDQSDDITLMMLGPAEDAQASDS